MTNTSADAAGEEMDGAGHDASSTPASGAASESDAQISPAGLPPTQPSYAEPIVPELETSEDNEAGEDEEDVDDDEEEEEDEEDEEPRLKYARLTSHLGPVYRNADATSSFLVAGDKMVIGTHNGNIHVIQLPLFQSLRVYHAHSASVTSVSVSPYPPPLSRPKHDLAAKIASHGTGSPHRPGSQASESHVSAAAASRKPKEPHAIPNTPSNNIHIATSSMDGNVCVQSLLDVKDVSLRNYARPVQAVALSPDYKNDRTYLSGGLAGQLILTVGAPYGRSTATTVGTAAAAAGWLGSVGLGTNTGKDTVLHSGEGTINAIKWSLSGKYVASINEHGVWIWRTGLHLDKSEAEDGWKRIGHVDRPQTEEWDTMATVWKGRLEWIDEGAADPDDADRETETNQPKVHQPKGSQKAERLLIGWGGIVWLVRVNPSDVGIGRNVGERSAANAEVLQKFRMDCIVSGISLYTRNQVLVLAYCLPDEEEDDDEEDTDVRTVRGHKSRASIASTGSEPAGGIKRRQNNLPPELRLIDLTSESEAPMESLSVSRFERLSASDYHLGVLPAQNAASVVASSKGALEAIANLSTEVWNAAINPKALFSSSASIKSRDSDGAGSGAKVPSASNTTLSPRPGGSVHPNLLKPGIKIFIHSPYDCILATKRDLADHLGWLLEREQYQEAWELVEEHPEIMTFADKPSEPSPGTPDKTPDKTQSSDDFYEETASVLDGMQKYYSSAEKEKRSIGGLWVQQLVKAGEWTRAGEVCGKVVGSADGWEKWVWAFAGANKFDEIANYMPTEPLRPPIRSIVYETVLGHYIHTDKPRFRELLDRWSTELYDLNAITSALEDQLKYREIRQHSIEDGEVGRDWRLVMESLAKLHEANGRNREALKCYIKLQDADSAMRLIKDGHLAEAVADDIPAFITLRVPQDHAETMTMEELEQATLEPITLLVDEAQHGLVKPSIVVNQLQEKVLNRYTFFYLRGLWRGEGIKEHSGEFRERLVLDSKSLVDVFADLAIHLFAIFDRSLLMDFLKTSTAYAFEKAVQECEDCNYIPELVYLYSKTGEMKRALYLIIDRLRDVSQAITFAKEQEDPDLWEDLLNYSMDKPRFIRGLLEEVGTAINPITLVRRIPEGLEIPGLREGLKHIMKEHEIQFSISAGVAKVLRSEVAAAQSLLRNGQRRGIKFEVTVQANDHVDVGAKNVPTPQPAQEGDDGLNDLEIKSKSPKKARKSEPGHCAQCHKPFTEWETETLVGFTCGHVFHLTHLMECLHPGEPVDMDFLLSQTEETSGSTHFVGPKVTRARLLRDRIRGGCPVCVNKDVPVYT